jgi:translocation and assembly module TamB
MWFFVYKQLAPQVESTVTKLLNRPVKLGPVEGFSPTGLRFGASSLPATSIDPDRATTEAVEVTFNLLPLLTDRTLPLDVTLVKPKAYIEQAQDTKWVDLKIQNLPKGAIDIKLNVLRVRDANVVLVPRGAAGNSRKPIALSISSGKALFLNNNKLIKFDLGGQLTAGGNLTINGDSIPATGQIKAAILGNDLSAPEVGRLIQLPLILQAGVIDGNLEVNSVPNKPLTFLGTAGLKNVTAQLDPLPKPFANTSGQLRFKGTQVRLEKVNTLFGQIPAQANGTVDTQAGFNLSAQTQAVQLPQVLQTFNIKTLPVAASAEVKADLQVTGTPAKPVVSGKFTTTKTAQIDKVQFRAIASDFGVVGSTLSVSNLRALPTLGGLVTGNGETQLGPKGGGVTFNFQGSNLPGDAIALTYDFKPPVPLGLISGKTQIVGSLNDAQNIRATGSANLKLAGGYVALRNIQVAGKRFSAQVQASDVQVGQLAEVPPQFRVPVSGNFTLSGPLTNITVATIQGNGSGSLNVAGGKVNATNVQLANGRFTAKGQASGVQVGQLAEVPPQFRVPVSGNFTLSGPLTDFSTAKVQGSGSGSLNVAGGKVNATNVQLADGRFSAQVQASGVQVERLAQVPPQVRGPLSGNFNLSGPLTDFSTEKIQGSGSGSLNIAGGTVTATNFKLADGRFSTQVRASGVPVERLAQVPPQVRGPLSGNFNLSGALNNLSPSTVQGSGSGTLNIAGGTVTATNLQLANGSFTVQGQASGVQVERLAQLPPQVRGALSGNFNLSGAVNNLSPSTVQGSGSGTLNIAGGTVTATNLQLANGSFTVQGQASGVQVQRLAQVPPQFRGALSGNFNLAGALDKLSPSTVQGSGSGTLNVAGGGTVTATNFQLADGRFQGLVEPTGVQLAGFSQDLRGRLSGRLNVAGSLASLSPAAIQASGQVNFSEGLALIDRSLTASINWNGQQLQIQQASAEGFNASGVVDVNLANQGLQALRSFNLNVQATDLDLQKLPITLPNGVNVAGRADFDGSIAGTPTQPVANGNLQLRNFVAAGLKFEPLLKGQVSAIPGQGVNLQLAGDKDRIQVALASNYQPVSFDIQRGDAIARGSRQGELLLVNTSKFPISLIKNLAPLPSAIASQPISGDLSGDLTVNLNTYGISGTVAIDKPIIASLRGDSFTGTLQYANGVADLKDGKFIQGNNQYLLSANVTQTPKGPQFQAKLDVPQGDIQSVLTALQIFDISDLTRGFNSPTYGKAANVTQVAAGLPEGTLQNQLRRISEIENLLQQRQEREDASPLPPLTQAKGQFSGTVSVVGSLTSGIKAEFNVQGKDWQWGSYSTKEVIAQGNFENGILSLLPLRFQSGESFASYSGTLGGDAQSGQLQLNKIPIEQVQTLLSKVTNQPQNLVGFTGFLNATATLSGSIKNPQARGVVTLADATLNRTNVQQALGSFSYSDARLNFGSTLQLASTTNPLNIGGSIPYKLPVATVAPASDKLNLSINVQDDGLALLNLFTGGQVSWVNGTGNVQLEVAGILNQQTNRPEQLVAKGSAVVNNATIKASALPDPLTNVEGQVQFNLDDIIVEKMTGQYSGGIITAMGTLPISQGASQEKQVAVNIGELGLNLKGLYKGRVRGDVAIAGTALSPKIGGQVTLFNGEVPLTEQAAATGGGGGGIGGDSSSSNGIEFNNLQLKLDQNIQITRAPILNFLADGTLTLNGSLGDLRPDGTIYLKRGQVNLFTTQFRLARSSDNTARFVPSQGLNPTLNVRLFALVSEATQRRLPSDPLSSEINDAPSLTGVGSVQTVRVQAKVEGLASEIADKIELTSSPARTKTELVALLGGSFVDTLGRGDTTLGLVNLAGSALLGNVQNIIGDALGLSEFRIYPTTITNDKNRRNSTLGLNAEAGVDIGRNLSVSVSKELTTDQPAQYGLRYRVNPKLILRGSTDLSGDSRAEVQYQTRF